MFCQPALDDAQLLSGTDLVAPRSGGHVLDPTQVSGVRCRDGNTFSLQGLNGDWQLCLLL